MPRCVRCFVVVGLLVAAGCSSGASKSDPVPPTTVAPTTTIVPSTGTEPLQGTVELHGRDESVVSIDGQEGSECGTPRVLQFSSGVLTPSIYDSWKEGAPVTIRDQHGAIIGKDILTTGTATAMSGATVKTCVFTFSADVPTDVETYQIAVGKAAPTTFRRADLERAHWRVWMEGTT